MHLQTHLALSWAVGHRLETRRDRALVTWAGLVPDLDGLTLLAGPSVYLRWHHTLTHGLLAAVATALVVLAFARQRGKAMLLALAAFHLHLGCDLLGSGPGWGITYLYPFSSHELSTSLAWNLASWQNLVITLGVFILCGWIGYQRGYTFLETFLPKLVDKTGVRMLRRLGKRLDKEQPRGLYQESPVMNKGQLASRMELHNEKDPNISDHGSHD